MKKLLIILLVALVPIFTIGQEKKKGLTVKPYGFLKGDMVYATGGVYSWGNPANSYLSAPQFSSGVDKPALGFTGQHSRFGLKIKGGDEIKVSGKLELDFYYGGFDANAKPRIRLAWGSVAKGNFEARFGQQWDVFSPINASTNNTNGNMWYAGNRGFRRAMIQILYKFPEVALLQFAVAEATKEATGLGWDNLSGSPMIQARISTKLMKIHTVGISIVSASFSPFKDDVDSTSFDESTADYDYSAFGYCIDFNLPFHKYFNVKGEFSSGKNLNDANLFSSSGSHGLITSYVNNSGWEPVEKDIESLGLWFNITSKIYDHFVVVIGYGMDKNQTENLPDGKVEQNTVMYGDLIFPISNGFSVALELQNISTKIKGVGDHSEVIVNLSGKLVF